MATLRETAKAYRERSRELWQEAQEVERQADALRARSRSYDAASYLLDRSVSGEWLDRCEAIDPLSVRLVRDARGQTQAAQRQAAE